MFSGGIFANGAAFAAFSVVVNWAVNRASSMGSTHKTIKVPQPNANVKGSSAEDNAKKSEIKIVDESISCCLDFAASFFILYQGVWKTNALLRRKFLCSRLYVL